MQLQRVRRLSWQMLQDAAILINAATSSEACDRESTAEIALCYNLWYHSITEVLRTPVHTWSLDISPLSLVVAYTVQDVARFEC
jgi:hypothetical protein